MNITTKYMTNNDCYRQGKTIKPMGIMVHSTASPGVMAESWYKRWNKANVNKCVHAFVDNKGIYQYLPWNYRGWHCGSGSKGSGNDTYVAFEICEPGTFSYGKGSTMIGYDVKENQAYFSAIWDNAVELCVMLCKQFNLTEKDIICHSEGHTRGIASNHGDVMHWFPKHGKTMDDFRKAVGLKLNYENESLSSSKAELESDSKMAEGKYLIGNVKVSANIRSAPNGEIIGTIPKGAEVSVTEFKNEYGNVGQNRWVHISLLVQINNAENPKMSEYIVKAGDTLSQIGKSLELDWREIAEINNIQSPYIIVPGQRLKLNSGANRIIYTVEKGDTLSKIGNKFGIPWKKIAELNNISSPYNIKVGEKILVKAGNT